MAHEEMLSLEALSTLSEARIMLTPGPYKVRGGSETTPYVLEREVYITITGSEGAITSEPTKILGLSFWKKDSATEEDKAKTGQIMHILTPSLERVMGIREQYTNNDVLNCLIKDNLEHPECDLSDKGLVLTIRALLKYASLISPELDGNKGENRQIAQIGKFTPSSSECLTQTYRDLKRVTGKEFSRYQLDI